MKSCSAWQTHWPSCLSRCAKSSSSNTVEVKRCNKSASTSAKASLRWPPTCEGAWKPYVYVCKARSKPMSAFDDPTGSHHDPLDAVIAEYLQEVETGAVPDRAAFLARYVD